MKKTTFYIIVIAMLFSLNVKGQITNNYKKVIPAKELKPAELNKAVVVTLKTDKGSKPSSTKTNRGLFELSEKGQKSLIEAYAAIDKDSDKLRKHF